jgi:hypothetical protein
MGDSINIPYMGKKLVTEALALVGVLDEACHVDEFDGCQRDLLRLENLCQLYKSFIRHCNDTDVRLNGAERIGLTWNGKGGQGIKNC